MWPEDSVHMLYCSLFREYLIELLLETVEACLESFVLNSIQELDRFNIESSSIVLLDC